ncbi:MAG: clostripain-related cysteine peptidase, partial [Elusimicrobiaceae bacterium]
MLKKCFAITAIAAFGLTGSVFAAGAVDFDNGVAISDIVNSDSFKDIETPKVKPGATAEWTIMVFVNGKNNLEEFALKDMNEMEAVGSNAKVNVVTEIGRINGYSSADGNWTGSRRYLVKKDTNANAITSPVVQTIAKADMGDWKHLVDFAKWAKTNYPAKHYMLIVWNHGAGWVKHPGASKGISYDDETNNHITTPQLAQALAGLGGVDVYGSDACLMQMVSVDYEIQKYVNYIVGSEETEPGDGYTYDLFLNMVNASNLSPEAVGKAAVNAYSDHYASIKQSSTQSLVKSSELIPLAQYMDAFVTAVMAANEKALVKQAAGATVSYAYEDNKGLSHFVSNVMAKTQNAQVKQAGAALNNYIDTKVVLLNRTNTFPSYYDNKDYKASKGIAVYLPESSYNPAY